MYLTTLLIYIKLIFKFKYKIIRLEYKAKSTSQAKIFTVLHTSLYDYNKSKPQLWGRDLFRLSP